MMFALKVDRIYILLYWMMVVCIIFILIFLNGSIFSTQEAIGFIAPIAISLFAILGLFYLRTYFQIENRAISVYYFGSIRKTVPMKQIKSIEKVDDGRGILSLSRDKLCLVMMSKEIVVSLKENDKFLYEVMKRD